MKLATINLPPYLYTPENASLLITENKRFTMKDIGTIEDRVSNLEEVTSLSLLETNVQTLQILDSQGRNRFKSGFFVDPFRNRNFLNNRLSDGIEVDTFSNVIIPKRDRVTVEVQPKLANPVPLVEYDSELNQPLFDSDVRKTGQLITLDYQEVEWISQEYATSFENINPFLIPTYMGIIKLTPASDIFTRTIEVEGQKIRQEGTNDTQNLNLNTTISGELGGDITQVNTRTEQLFLTPGQGQAQGIANNSTQVFRETTGTSTITGQLSLNGSASDSVTVLNTDTVINNRLTSETAQYMRSRNVQFESSSFPSYTRFYTFLDKETIDFNPKLVEVSPTSDGAGSGTSNSSFEIGETVRAENNQGQIIGKFRVCKPDHKSGPFDNPTESYRFNPYSYQNDNADIVPQNYSQTTPILNIDTLALSDISNINYFGYLDTGFKLVGESSACEAYVKNKRLVSDEKGDLLGTFFVKNANFPENKKWNVGTKTFLLTSSPDNATFIPGVDPNIFAAQVPFTSQGTRLEFEKQVIETVNSTTFNINADFEATVDTNISLTQVDELILEAEYYDPLAQTFVIGSKDPNSKSATNQSGDENGAYVTSVEVFFRTVDPNAPVSLEIRGTDEGSRPNMNI